MRILAAVRGLRVGTADGRQRLKLTAGHTTDYVVWRKGRVVSVIAHAYAEASPRFVVEVHETADELLADAGYS